MLALSGRQPWWYAILRLGKRIENRVPRSSATSQLAKHIGEPIALHASSRPNTAQKRREFDEDCRAIVRTLCTPTTDATSTMLARFYEECVARGHITLPYEPSAMLAFGAIVGTCRVVGVLDIHGNPIGGASALALSQLQLTDPDAMRWHIRGQIGHILADVAPVVVTPCTGALGLWQVPEHVMRAAMDPPMDLDLRTSMAVAR